jgi:hypothetical protein
MGGLTCGLVIGGPLSIRIVAASTGVPSGAWRTATPGEPTNVPAAEGDRADNAPKQPVSDRPLKRAATKRAERVGIVDPREHRGFCRIT